MDFEHENHQHNPTIDRILNENKEILKGEIKKKLKIRITMKEKSGK